MPENPTSEELVKHNIKPSKVYIEMSKQMEKRMKENGHEDYEGPCHNFH